MEKEINQNPEVARLDSSSFLRLELQKAIRANPRFSLRAFAIKLGLSAGALSNILSRKKRISMDRAQELAVRMNLTESERERFLLIVKFENATSPTVKSEAYEKLKSNGDVFNLALENFQMISEWYGFAILEMITAFASAWSSAEIAEYLNLPKIDVEVMIERLERLELIERAKDGSLNRVPSRLLVRSGTPDEALRKYQKSVQSKSIESIETQTPSEKVIGTEVFAFDTAQIDDVKKLTDRYLNDLIALSEKGKNRTELYQAFTNVFRLNQRTNPTQKTQRKK